MSFNSDQNQEMTVVKWEGPLGVDNHTLFKERMQTLIAGGEKQFLFDLSRVDFIDSTGLGVMTSLLRQLRQEGGDLLLMGLADNVKSIFEITGLKKLFTIVSTLEEAKGKIG